VKYEVGLWLDHRHAVVVYLAHGETRTTHIASGVERHVRSTGGSRSSLPYGPQDVSKGDGIDRKHRLHCEQYYRKLAKAVHGAESLLILGPGEAKGEFHRHLRNGKTTPRPCIVVEPADKMTEPQIVARVKKHFATAGDGSAPAPDKPAPA
jgi:hypothetical protein